MVLGFTFIHNNLISYAKELTTHQKRILRVRQNSNQPTT